MAEVKLVFECEDVNKGLLDVEYSFDELVNKLGRISNNGMIQKVKSMHTVQMFNGHEMYGSLEEHFENTCDMYCESMDEKEFEWMIDRLVENTKQYLRTKVGNMV